MKYRQIKHKGGVLDNDAGVAATSKCLLPARDDILYKIIMVSLEWHYHWIADGTFNFQLANSHAATTNEYDSTQVIYRYEAHITEDKNQYSMIQIPFPDNYFEESVYYLGTAGGSNVDGSFKLYYEEIQKNDIKNS